MNRITQHLRDGELLAVKTLPSRYLSGVAPAKTDANLDPGALLVLSIAIELIHKE